MPPDPGRAWRGSSVPSGSACGYEVSWPRHVSAPNDKARVFQARASLTCASTVWLGFLLCLCGSCFLLRRILGAGLSERTRIQLAALGAAVTLTHSLLPCSARSTAGPLRCPTAARQSCPECGHRRLPS